MQLTRQRGRCRLIWALLVLIIGSGGFAAAEEPMPEALSSKELKKAAYDSLWRLQRAIERDGYYSARVALNLWRSNAVDAGIFDAGKYEEFKQQIYEKSIQNSLRCFDNAIETGSTLEARICLHTWKTHSEAMDEFDADLYEGLQKKLTALSEKTSK